jgi:hypothetical protein
VRTKAQNIMQLLIIVKTRKQAFRRVYFTNIVNITYLVDVDWLLSVLVDGSGVVLVFDAHCTFFACLFKACCSLLLLVNFW